MAQVRTFIAVDVGSAIRRTATTLQKLLAQCGADVKWVEPENLHLTLIFLGEVDDRELHAVCRAVSKAVVRESPFPIRVAGVGAFPTPRRPKTIWAGITDGAENLARIHDLIEPPLVELGGYRREDRPYTPHLTLGRINGEANSNLIAAEIPKHLAWAGGHSAIEEILVIGSELRRGGPTYTILGRAPLEGAMDE